MAYEIARRLQARAREIRLVGLIDAPPAHVFSPTRRKANAAPIGRMYSSWTKHPWLLNRYVHSLSDYHPGQYKGRITLLGVGLDTSSSWKQLAEAVRFHRITGNHVTCLGRFIDKTAAALKSCMEE